MLPNTLVLCFGRLKQGKPFPETSQQSQDGRHQAQVQ